MKLDLGTTKDQPDEQGLLLVLVGESGAGKSTFCKFVDRSEGYYCSSEAIEKAIKAEGQQVNHDSIHAFANKAYRDNPEWQVPGILDSIKKKGYLILDGPRRLAEVKALKEKNPNTLIVRITAPETERLKRLQTRDGIDVEAFKRIIRDESEETELGQILLMSDKVINNNNGLDKLKESAIEVQQLLDGIHEKLVNNII